MIRFVSILNEAMAGTVRRFLLRLVLEEAISREEKAYRFYETALEAVRDPAAAGLLRRLAAEELRHRLKLEDLQRSGALDLARPVEAEPDQAGLLADPGPQWPAQIDRLEPRDIWAVALAKERLARDHYSLLASRSPVAAFREVFAYLSAEEQRHVDWVGEALKAVEGAGA
jgi:rubrerythrin